MFDTKAPEERPAAAPLGRRFQQVLTAITVSSLGDGMRFVALPLLAARISADPRDLALVSTVGQLPWLLLSLPAGALADRVDRRRLLVAVDTARTLLVAGFAVAVAFDAVSIALLAVVAFLLGWGQTLYNAGWSGVVPGLVEPDDRTRANGRVQAGALVADSLVGTSLGTVLFAAAALLPFTVDATSFAVAALLMLLLPGGLPRRDDVASQAPTAGGLRALFGSAGEGVRKLIRHRLLTTLTLVATVFNLVMAAMIAVLVLYAREVLHLAPIGYGLLVGAFAVGGIAGSLGAPVLVRRLGGGRTLLVTLVGTGAAVGAAGLSSHWLWAGLATTCYGACHLAWGVTAISIRQDVVPERLLGRISMAHQMVANGGMAIGALLGGLVAHAWGLRAPMLCGAVLLLLITPAMAWVLRDSRALRQRVAADAVTASSRLAPEPAAAE